jgi:hypothetical protein
VTASEPDHLGALAVAVACLVPAIPAGWKAASLKGDTFRKWAGRVDVAHAGLATRATGELVALQEQIGDVLGGPADSEALLPAQSFADPAPLVAGANRCADLLRTRDKLRRRFRRDCRLGPALIAAVAVYIPGWAAATLHYTDVVDPKWVGVVGLIVGGLAVAVAVAVFVLYAYYEGKLAAAEAKAAGQA